MAVHVLIEKDTNKMIAIEENGQWVISNNYDLIRYGDGIEPILSDVDGVLYLNTNASIMYPDA